MERVDLDEVRPQDVVAAVIADRQPRLVKASQRECAVLLPWEECWDEFLDAHPDVVESPLENWREGPQLSVGALQLALPGAQQAMVAVDAQEDRVLALVGLEQFEKFSAELSFEGAGAAVAAREFGRAVSLLDVLVARGPSAELLELRALANAVLRKKRTLALEDLERAAALSPEGPDRETRLAGARFLAADVFFGQSRRAPPHFQAARYGFISSLRWLLAHGAGVEEGQPRRNSTVESPLSAACRSGFVEIARVLLDAGANLEASHDTNLIGGARHWTPLMQAAHGGHLELVKLLLDRGANLHYRDEEDCTPLCVASKAPGDDSPETIARAGPVLELLLARGARVTEKVQQDRAKIEEARARAERGAENRRRFPDRNRDRKYFVLVTGTVRSDHWIDTLPEGAPEAYRFGAGEPLLAEWPVGASVRLHSLQDGMGGEASGPGALVRELADGLLEGFVSNQFGLLVASPRTQRLLRELGVEMELLPLAIRSPYDETVLAPDHAIVNLLGTQDAIDLERSRIEMDSLDRSQIGHVGELVLDRSNIDENAKLFLASAYLSKPFLRDDAKAAFEAAGLTGWEGFDADGWDGLEC